MVDASSFALFELDAKQCRIGLWQPESAGVDLGVSELATIAPVLALGPDGTWLHGEPAMARRLLAPNCCVLDLLETPQPHAWQERSASWPFARPVSHAEHGYCWSIEEKLYPRAYLLSRLLLVARELSEDKVQGELRSMALVAGRTVTPSLREDFERAAKLAGVSRLWWIDRMHALARCIQHAQQQASVPSSAPEPQSSVEDEQDALTQIHEALGVQSVQGPSQASLSHAEFGSGPAATPSVQMEQTSAGAQSPDAQDPSAQAQMQEGEPEDAVHETPEHPDSEWQGSEPETAPTHAQADGENDGAVHEASGHPDSERQGSEPSLGQWLWVADRMGLELAQLSLSPAIELHSRDLILGVSQLEWQAKVVAQLHEDLDDDQGLELGESRLAQVRVWDACGKMMERLEAQAQTELHLPHLCVRKDQSYHYKGAWHRRRMDALVADAVHQLKARCQEDQEDQAWQWGRYGSASEMPAFVRVAQQCDWLSRKDSKLPENSALIGAGIWIQERQGSRSRSLASDIMLGDLVWEHPSGFRKRLALHGQSLPLSEDLDLQGAQLDADDDSPWSLYLCLPGSQEEQEDRHCVARVLMPDYASDGRVRIQVQRNAKILLSRAPAAKNAGAQDLVFLEAGLSSEQIQDLELDQMKRDLDRFMGMRAQAMRKDLAKHCTQLASVLSERGDKMDDLLRTQIGEWVASAKEVLTPDLEEQSNKAALALLSPLHESFVAMVETFSPAQKKSLVIEQAKLPKLLETPQELGMPSGTKPWWIGDPRPQSA